MNTSRIPEFVDTSLGGMSAWFAEMSARELLFHPDDLPEEIISKGGERIFNVEECLRLNETLGEMFARFGDGVYEAAYPAFMKALGNRLDE